MARILIGSSNIRRFYPCDQTSDYPKYKVEAATLQRAFEITIESIPDDAKVVISVLENFIEKEVNIKPAGEKETAMKKVMQSVVAAVVASARQRRGARFALAYPILRPKNEWMTENEDVIRKEFEAAVNAQCEMNVSKIDAVARGSQEFEKDGVHLTLEAGRNFVGNLIGMAEENFKAVQIDFAQEEDDDDDDQISKVIKLGSASAAAKASSNLTDLKKVTKELKDWKGHLEKHLNSRFRSDNIMFARLRDEMDSETNRKREDRTQVTGLIDSAIIPKTTLERNEFLRKSATDFCKSIKEDFDGEVLFASTSGRPEKGNLILEFRINTVEKAREIRKAFAVKKSANNLQADMEKIQVMPVTTLATKVRVDVMKAIARRLESNTIAAYVPNFLPRPILHIKAKDAGGQPRRHISSLTFADAIMEHGGLIKGGDLTSAYRRAGGNFRGQMRQHFVLLDDQEMHNTKFTAPPPPIAKSNPVAGGSNVGKEVPRGTKRSSNEMGSGSGSEADGGKRNQPRS
jgi:hypothetical protein